MFADIRVCLSLLSPEARWRWLALLPLALAAAAAEAVGAGAAFGLITILGDPARAAPLPVVAGIVVVLAIASPGVTAIAVVVVGGLLLLPLTLSRKATTRWGQAVSQLDTDILQTLQQSLGGVKEVKVIGRESFFLAQFDERMAAAAGLRSRYVAVDRKSVV